jgi:hypothetical protein
VVCHDAAPEALRWLRVAAVLTTATNASTDHGTGDPGAAWFWGLVSLALLWRVWRGSYAAWLASGVLAGLGALLYGGVVLAEAVAHPTGEPAENAQRLALLYLVTLVVLTCEPVRSLVTDSGTGGS